MRLVPLFNYTTYSLLQVLILLHLVLLGYKYTVVYQLYTDIIWGDETVNVSA